MSFSYVEVSQEKNAAVVGCACILVNSEKKLDKNCFLVKEHISDNHVNSTLMVSFKAIGYPQKRRKKLVILTQIIQSSQFWEISDFNARHGTNP